MGFALSARAMNNQTPAPSGATLPGGKAGGGEKGRREKMKSLYVDMMRTYDHLTGLRPLDKPRSYPWNWTGLLHKADNVLIFSRNNDYHKAAQEIRRICYDKLLNLK